MQSSLQASLHFKSRWLPAHLGAPTQWVEHPRGQFPPALRIAAMIQAVLLAGMAAVILARAGLILPGWSQVSHWLVWIVVALTAFGLVLNLITPSAGERAIWAPTLSLLLISSLIVVFSSAPATTAA